MPQIHCIIRPADEEALFEVLQHQGCMQEDWFTGQQVHQSLMAVENLAASPRRTRVTSVAMRRKVTSHVGWSPNLVAKQPLRSRSKRVRIIVNALLGPVQKAVITRVTRNQRNMAKSHISHIRSVIVSRHRGVEFQAWFLNVLLFLIKYTVNNC